MLGVRMCPLSLALLMMVFPPEIILPWHHSSKSEHLGHIYTNVLLLLLNNGIVNYLNRFRNKCQSLGNIARNEYHNRNMYA